MASAALASPVAAQVKREASAGAQLVVTHDTNVARTSKGVAALRGIEPEDTVFAPSINLGYVQPVGRNSVFLRGGVGYRLYLKNDDLNNEFADLTGGLNVRIGRCSGELVGSFARRERNVQDLAIPDPRVIQDTKSSELREVCGITESIGLMLGGGRVWQDANGSAIAADSESTSYTAGLVFRRSSLGELQLFGSHVETEYGAPAAVGGKRSYEVESLSVRYNRQIGSRMRGGVMVAQTDVKSDAPTAGGSSSDFSGITYAANLTYVPTSKLTIDMILDRSVAPALELSRLYSVRETAAVDIAYQVSSRITASVGASRRQVEADGAVVSPGSSIVESEAEDYRAALRFKQSDRISFILDAAHTKYDANDPVLNYSATRVSLTTIVGF